MTYTMAATVLVQTIKYSKYFFFFCLFCFVRWIWERSNLMSCHQRNIIGKRSFVYFMLSEEGPDPIITTLRTWQAIHAIIVQFNEQTHRTGCMINIKSSSNQQSTDSSTNCPWAWVGKRCTFLLLFSYSWLLSLFFFALFLFYVVWTDKYSPFIADWKDKKTFS